MIKDEEYLKSKASYCLDLAKKLGATDASVTVGNGKFYTLETGANEKRWRKMADKIKKVQKSFVVGDRTDY